MATLGGSLFEEKTAKDLEESAIHPTDFEDSGVLKAPPLGNYIRLLSFNITRVSNLSTSSSKSNCHVAYFLCLTTRCKQILFFRASQNVCT